MKLGKKIYSGYVFVLSVMTIISVVVFMSINSIIDTSKWVNHTYKVIRTGESLLASMVDMETGQRGFMVTGQDAYLEPYNNGLKSFDLLIKQGQQLTSDNPAQGKRWQDVGALKRQWQQEVAEPEISARREVALGAASMANFKRISSRTVGKQIFDGIRVMLADLETKFRSQNNTRGINLITLITLDLVNMETGQRGYLLTGLDESLEPFKGGKSDLTSHIETLRSVLAGSAVTRTDLQSLEAEVNKWIDQAAQPEINARRDMNRYPKTIEDIALMMSSGQGKNLMDATRAKINEIVAAEEKLIIVRRDEQLSASTFGIGFTVISNLIAILAGMIIAVFTVRGVMAPISATNSILKELSQGEGDLTKRVPVTSQDEIGELSEYFNAFVSKLQGIVKDVIESAAQLAVASQQMNQLSQSTTNGLHQQNQETMQVASAMTEMASTVEEVARNSQSTSDAAKYADQQAQSGNSIVAATVTKINELAADVESSASILSKLKDDSGNISAVLDVIKNIADQTNLLALNAAIEAARAGEQGRGFAVVADEVRTLAQRTQDSTSEIEGLISTLQNGADSAVAAMQKNRTKTIETVEQAAQAGEFLKAITEGVSKILDMSNQIAVASEEQSAVAQGINHSIHNIQNVSEETAVNSKQTSTASAEVADLGSRLHRLVEQFKV